MFFFAGNLIGNREVTHGLRAQINGVEMARSIFRGELTIRRGIALFRISRVSGIMNGRRDLAMGGSVFNLLKNVPEKLSINNGI